MVQTVVAIEPTQQFNKIFLNPFYRASTSANTNYNYTVVVNPPDAISSVKSAIVTFKAYIAPTVTFNLTVNGASCNNPLYTVSTTYSTTGQGEITFDCSNRINRSGTYTLVLRPTQANTGAITGWLDLTYMNDPMGTVLVHGTEYVPGDDGKLFLQFLDSEFQPVNNSECFLTLWYPNATKMLNNTLMSKLDEGIYYKNFLVPNVTGVYPASAKCYRPVTFYNDIKYNYVVDTFDSGTWTGGTGWSECPLGDPDCHVGWDVEDTVPLSTLVTNAGAGTGGCYNASAYCARYTGGYGFIERGFPEIVLDGVKGYNITYKLKFAGFQTGETAEFFVFDGNWHLMRQVNLAGGYLNNVWYDFSEYIDDTEFNIEGSILIGWYTRSMPSTNDLVYIDEVRINAIAANITLSNETDYQILRGSGEVHVSNFYNQVSPQVVAAAVWNHTPDRYLTYERDTTNYTLVEQYVWNATNRTLTYYPPTAVDYAGIWNFTTRNLTYTPDMTNYTRIQNETNLTVKGLLESFFDAFMSVFSG